MTDPFPRWLDALEKRHRSTLSFQEVRRAVQALSALYVERRNRIEQGSPFDGAGKRAAFATYFAPLHFLLVREIVRALDAGSAASSEILDLGCGTGIAGAAWALEMKSPPKVTAVDRNPWTIREAKWTCGTLNLQAAVRFDNLATFRIAKTPGVIAAFTIDELSPAAREHILRELVSAARRGSSVLVIEPIARSVTPWWPGWVREWNAIGGREDSWRFSIPLPEPLALMDKASGLDHRELTGRSLWIPGGQQNLKLEIADGAPKHGNAEPEEKRQKSG